MTRKCPICGSFQVVSRHVLDGMSLPAPATNENLGRLVHAVHRNTALNKNSEHIPKHWDELTLGERDCYTQQALAVKRCTLAGVQGVSVVTAHPPVVGLSWKDPEMYYFGCWNSVGHYLRDDLGNDKHHAIKLPWLGEEIDNGLCPGTRDVMGDIPNRDQHEGHARLTYAIKDEVEWTALAFWDRSVDRRCNSNSVFIACGHYPFEEMIALSKKRFPKIWERFKFDVVLE